MGARGITFSTPAQPVADARPVAYVSAETLGQLLDISPSTVWEWARKGHLPKPKKIGGSTRWKWTDVEKRIEGASTAETVDPILEASRGG